MAPTSETGPAWNEFFADLVARGLSGVRLVTSDAHAGLVEAVAANLPGAAWQQWRTHYAASLMGLAPKAMWPAVKAMLHSPGHTTRSEDARTVINQLAAAYGTPTELPSSMGYAKRRMMELEERGFDEVDGAVCLAHVKDPVLAASLEHVVTERACRACNRTAEESEAAFAVPFEDLLSKIVDAVHRHYVDAHAEGVPWDSEEGRYMGAAIYDTGDVINEIGQEALTEDAFDSLVDDMIGAVGHTDWTDARGAYSSDTLDWQWEEFVTTVQSKSRFVVVNEADDPDAPHELATFLRQVAIYVDGGLGLLDTVGPGATFYRARLTDEPDKIAHECRGLQPAPSDKATANRMSPAGIPMFYAAEDLQTAIAEVAGHGPQPYAIVGAFGTTKPLTILDFTRKPILPSYFDEERHPEFGLALFLKYFVASITRPVIPDGRQHVEYTPTQLITEYLRWATATPIDGIALPSAQTGRKTYVLFFTGDDCADAEGPGSTEEERTSLLGYMMTSREPTFTLSKSDIFAYRIERSYRGVRVDRPADLGSGDPFN